MITTTREFTSALTSSPWPTEISEPPSTPPRPASAQPTVNAIAKISWMLTPSAETIWRSSTPARMIIPVRVRFSQK